MRLFGTILLMSVWFCSSGAVCVHADAPPQLRASTFDEMHAKAIAANPAGLIFTLRTKGGRTVFHCGERIPIELVFENHTGKVYNCLAFDAARRTVGQVDQFVTDRPGDAVDPMSNMFRDQRSPVAGSWPVAPFGAEPMAVATELNTWLALDRPGVYKLYDKTYRVTTGSDAFTLLTDAGTKPLVSNVVTITVLPNDPGWENQTLQMAMHGLNSYQNYFSFQTLTYLRTLTSGMTLLRMCEDRIEVDDRLRYDCIAALVDSPYRLELFRALQSDFKNPDVGITGESQEAYALLDYSLHDSAHDGGTMIGLAKSQRRGAATDLLRSFYPRKRGRARAVTAATLAYGDVKRTPYTSDLIGCFDLLPSHQQYDLLKSDTPYAHDAGIEPALLRLLEAPPVSGLTYQKEARAIALQRLLELDPDQARSLILREVQKKWPTVSVGPLLRMPGPVPDLDGVLLHNFRLACAGKANLCVQAFLIGRYGSAAIRAPIEEIFQQRKRGWQIMQYMDRPPPYDEVLPPLFSYFYRIDPTFAEAQRSTVSDALLYTEPVMASVGFSPRLEKVLIANLHSSDSDTVYNAATALAQYGRAEHKASLLAALHPLGSTIDRSVANVNDALSGPLAEGKRWVLTQSEAELLAKASPAYAESLTDDTGVHTIKFRRDTATSMFDRDPTGWVHGLWHVDNCDLDTKAELKEKLLLYPVGTKFTMAVDQKWWRARIFAELSAFLKAHGMSLDEKK